MIRQTLASGRAPSTVDISSYFYFSWIQVIPAELYRVWNFTHFHLSAFNVLIIIPFVWNASVISCSSFWSSISHAPVKSSSVTAVLVTVRVITSSSKFVFLQCDFWSDSFLLGRDTTFLEFFRDARVFEGILLSSCLMHLDTRSWIMTLIRFDFLRRVCIFSHEAYLLSIQYEYRSFNDWIQF